MIEGELTHSYKAGELLTISGVSPTPLQLSWCPEGQFVMGSSAEQSWIDADERPAHPITISKGFWLSRFLVTEELWLSVMGVKSRNWLDKPHQPVSNVSWSQAVSFCAELTKLVHNQTSLSANLPTEAEWEYACRAGTTSIWHFGDDISMLGNYGWYKDNSENSTQEVGQRIANSWELYDLYGNVSEWCLDSYIYYTHLVDQITDPLCFDGEAYLKVVRGGSFQDLDITCRSTKRITLSANNPFSEAVGIRFTLKGTPNRNR